MAALGAMFNSVVKSIKPPLPEAPDDSETDSDVKEAPKSKSKSKAKAKAKPKPKSRQRVPMDEDEDYDDDDDDNDKPETPPRVSARSKKAGVVTPGKKVDAEVKELIESIRLLAVEQSPERRNKCTKCGKPGHAKNACASQDWVYKADDIVETIINKLAQRPTVLRAIIAAAQQ